MFKIKMENIPVFLYSTILCMYTIGCINENKTVKSDYYIISQNDSTNSVIVNGKLTDSCLNCPPPPPPPIGLKWYSNIVFIMDSTDRVYIYQTEEKVLNEIKFTAPVYVDTVVENDKKYTSVDTLNYENKLPNYIGLRPEYLVAIDSKDLISFINLNDDIFQFNNNERFGPIFIYIASNMDTIMNEAFYDLKNLAFSDKKPKRIIYLIRKTTEEENIVINYKRNNSEYKPEKIRWTTNFIDGKSRPFTKEYNKIERRTLILRKAIETFRKASLDINPTP